MINSLSQANAKNPALIKNSEVHKMGKITGKPGPNPRTPTEKAALKLPNGHSYGGPHRPATDELKSREEKRLKGNQQLRA